MERKSSDNKILGTITKSNLIYSYLLLFVIIADSLFTLYVGKESNPLLLAIMKSFDLTLLQMMMIRTVALSILIWLVYILVEKWIKYVLVAYISLYGLLIMII